MHMTSACPRSLPPQRPVRRLLKWLASLGCLLLAPLAWAGSLQVSPILLEFPAGEQATGLWLSNSGTTPIRAQVRIQQWSQADGVEQLDPTQGLVASPPILEIAPGQQQLVRIVRQQANAPTQELAYRVLVDELPDAQAEDRTGLQLLLRYSIPAFVLPQGTGDARQAHKPTATDLSQVAAHLQLKADAALLTVSNRGRQRIRLSQLVHVDAQGVRTPLVTGLMGYVLAGQRMQWTLPLADHALHGGTLKAKFNDDLEEQSLPLDPASR